MPPKEVPYYLESLYFSCCTKSVCNLGLSTILCLRTDTIRSCDGPHCHDVCEGPLRSFGCCGLSRLYVVLRFSLPCVSTIGHDKDLSTNLALNVVISIANVVVLAAGPVAFARQLIILP